jgi:alpha-L-fucosidase 2
MDGSMLHQADDTLRLQVFRADVHDHRDETYGWTAYSRPRLQIGHISLHTVGKLMGCTWRRNLWNAELTGTLTTDQGEIRICHFTHAQAMAIVTELTPSDGEQACRWTWHPKAARTTRGGYPTDEAGIERFARGYGEHYAENGDLGMVRSLQQQIAYEAYLAVSFLLRVRKRALRMYARGAEIFKYVTENRIT